MMCEKPLRQRHNLKHGIPFTRDLSEVRSLPRPPAYPLDYADLCILMRCMTRHVEMREQGMNLSAQSVRGACAGFTVRSRVIRT